MADGCVDRLGQKVTFIENHLVTAPTHVPRGHTQDPNDAKNDGVISVDSRFWIVRLRKNCGGFGDPSPTLPWYDEAWWFDEPAVGRIVAGDRWRPGAPFAAGGRIVA